MSIRVLIVEPATQGRDQLAAQLTEAADIEVVGCTNSPAEALVLIKCSDLALVSTSLPEDGAYQLLRLAYKNDPCNRLLILEDGEPRSLVMRYLEAGAYAYLPRFIDMEKLTTCIRSIARGEAALSGEQAAHLISRLAELSAWMEEMHLASGIAGQLTRREREVLYLIGRNFTNQDIANHLIIEVGTVKNHVHNILAKLKVNSRREAASFASLTHDRHRLGRYSQAAGTGLENYVS
jgi:DNA-binding NarL/FixJ family response regulator